VSDSNDLNGTGGERPLEVLVIGGGVTGLATAFRVLSGSKNGRRVAVTLVESSDRFGGKINTVREEGLILDGGPDAFVANKPFATRLCKDLGLGDRLIETIPENRSVYIQRKGRLHKLPEGVILGVPTRILPMVTSPLFSKRGLARMGLDLVLPKGRDPDESMASFVERRLGREALDRLAEPLLGGIYVGDPHKLSIRATFPQLAELEDAHRSLMLGTLKTRKLPKHGPPPSAFYSLKSGMSELPETLAKRVGELGATILTKTRVTDIAERSGGYDVTVRDADGNERTLSAEHVVLAVPAAVATGLLAKIEPVASSILGSIEYVSSATCLLAYPRSAVPHRMDAVGALIPKHEGPRILAISFMTSKWPFRGPDDTAVLRVFFGGYERESDVTVDDATMLATAKRDLGTVLGVRGEPKIARFFRYVKANPQPFVGHLDRMRRVREALARHKGLHIGGMAYDGVGIPDCARQSEEIAKKILS
jgi:oxygen-dependent protoporphyrinogen oxidase